MTWFLCCVPNWFLSRPFDLILLLCTQLTPFKTIWPNFIIVYPIYSFQDHLTSIYYCLPNLLLSRPFDLILSLCFYHCVPNWLLSRPHYLIFALWTLLIPFKTIWGKEEKWSWKESIGYTIQKSGQMVLKGFNWVHNNTIRSNGLERSQLGTQW